MFYCVGIYFFLQFYCIIYILCASIGIYNNKFHNTNIYIQGVPFKVIILIYSETIAMKKRRKKNWPYVNKIKGDMLGVLVPCLDMALVDLSRLSWSDES